MAASTVSSLALTVAAITALTVWKYAISAKSMYAILALMIMIAMRSVNRSLITLY